MRMKIPNSGSGNGYYGQEAIISPYMSDASSNASSETPSLDSPTQDGDFTEYMWMANEEEFEKQVMQQLEEEELMEQCMEAMLEDETEIRNIHNSTGHAAPAAPFAIPGSSSQIECVDNGFDLTRHLQTLRVQDPQLASQSTLNPNAQEFVPQRRTLVITTMANGAS